MDNQREFDTNYSTKADLLFELRALELRESSGGFDETAAQRIRELKDLILRRHDAGKPILRQS